MTATTSALPMRPRGAARRTAAVVPAAYPTRRARHVAVGPARASRATPSDLPSRRALHTASPSVVPAAFGRTVAEAVRLPLRAFGTAVASARAVPPTAATVVACLVVSVATPQASVAAPTLAARSAVSGQAFTAAVVSSPSVGRDAFAIGRVHGSTTGDAPPPSGDRASAVRPVVGSIPAAGGFGSRSVRGCSACSTDHQGLDFAAPTGTAVLAAMTGRVVSAGVSGGYGNQILLEHADGTRTRYGHLSRISVRPGSSVAAGQRIGDVGSTGVSTGSHLHFEVIVGGTPVDPAGWLADRGLL